MQNQAEPGKQLAQEEGVVCCRISLFSSEPYVLGALPLCQVANKGTILHSWGHVAGAIRLMGFGLNLRPAPLRGTNAGFLQMSVSQYHEWKIVSWQEKEHINLATEEAIVSKKFHFQLGQFVFRGRTDQPEWTSGDSRAWGCSLYY